MKSTSFTGSMPSHTAPALQAPDDSGAATTSTLPHHVATLIADFMHPAPLRLEYRHMFVAISEYRYVCIILILMFVFSIAEFEQPGWFPRPEELSIAVVRTLSRILTASCKTNALIRRPGRFPWRCNSHIPCFRTARVRRNTHLALGRRGLRMAVGSPPLEWYGLQ
jgi:hypothetical protein